MEILMEMARNIAKAKELMENEILMEIWLDGQILMARWPDIDGEMENQIFMPGNGFLTLDRC